MGRRSRKERGPEAADRPRAAAPAPAPRSSSRIDDRPKPPWHPVPLIEISVLIGIVMLVLGFLRLDEREGRILVVGGLALGSLGGLDTVIREHFAGFRSHSLLLAGFPAVTLAGALYFAKVPWPLLVGAAVAVFAAALVGFRRAFRARSGGLSFR